MGNWNGLELPESYFHDDDVYIIKGDCQQVMPQIPDKCINLVLCDLPYGATRNEWDNKLPLNFLWAAWWRVSKDNTPVVLTATEPFSSELVISQKQNFRYEWIWDKKLPVGFLNAKKMPLRRHEIILVFYRKLPTYNPEMVTRGKPRVKGITTKTGKHTTNYGDFQSMSKVSNEYYPTSILEIGNTDRSNGKHPTQKPEALFSYLIKTYTNDNNIVLDNCLGYGPTAVCAKGKTESVSV